MKLKNGKKDREISKYMQYARSHDCKDVQLKPLFPICNKYVICK